MTFLPIVEREMQVAARRRATHWMRAVFGLVAVGLGVFVFLVNRNAPPADLGRFLLGTLVWLGLIFCLLCGVHATADCLSQEKREGTLGLLFLTDLRGHDVILGKLAATSLSVFYWTLATFPVLAVPLMLGGVPVDEFWRALLVLANTLLFSLAAGMFVSSLSQNGRKARAATFGLLLLLVGGLPLVAALIYNFVPSHRSRIADVLVLPCPFYTLATTGYGTSLAHRRIFWTSLGVTHGLTWVFLALATVIAPRTWQERPARGWRLRWQEAWRRLVYGRAEGNRIARARLLDRNPIAWQASRDRIKPALVWGSLGLVAGFWGWGCVRAGSEWFNEGVYLPTAILLNSLLKFWVASEAGRQLGEDHKSGALELVLATPLSVKEMLRGQWQALRRQLQAPFLLIVAVELIFLAASLQRESFSAQPINPVLWLAGLTMLVADVLALGWVALWGALTAKDPARTTTFALLRLVAAPWLLYVAVLILIALWVDESHLPVDRIITWKLYVGLWFGLGLLIDLGYGLAAAWRLRTRFRALALRRYEPKRPLLGRWFRAGVTRS